MPHASRRRSSAGICPICAGTAMMPRSAPEHVRVQCPNCAGTGAVA